MTQLPPPGPLSMVQLMKGTLPPVPLIAKAMLVIGVIGEGMAPFYAAKAEMFRAPGIPDAIYVLALLTPDLFAGCRDCNAGVITMKKTTVAGIFWLGAGICVITSGSGLHGNDTPLCLCSGAWHLRFPSRWYFSGGWLDNQEVTSRSSGTDMIAELVLATFFGLLLLVLDWKPIAWVQRLTRPSGRRSCTCSNFLSKQHGSR